MKDMENVKPPPTLPCLPPQPVLASASGSGQTREFDSGLMAQNKVRTKLRTREKIEKMVTEGTKNYPAYLKLIYTGDSDFSSEDEMVMDNRKLQARKRRSPRVTPEKEDMGTEKFLGQDDEGMENCPLEDEVLPSGVACSIKGERENETFYDTSEASTPEYDNALNQSQKKTEPTAAELAEKERQEAEWRAELAKLEEEITTLQSVLHAKVRQQSELKRKLGITAMSELKQDMQQGIKNIKDSNAVRATNEQWNKLNSAFYSSAAYQKTNEKVQHWQESLSSTDAYQKTSAAFKNFGAYTSRKMGDLRNSNAFKSIEDKMSGAYTNVKGKVSGSKSENNFEDVLSSTAQADSGPSSPSGDTAPAEPKPEEKVPL